MLVAAHTTIQLVNLFLVDALSRIIRTGKHKHARTLMLVLLDVFGSRVQVARIYIDIALASN